MLRSENWPTLLEPIIRKYVADALKEIPEQKNKIFNVQKSDKAKVEVTSVGSLGDFEEFKGQVLYDEIYPGYKTTYEFPEYVKGIQIERKIYDDDQTQIIKNRSKLIGVSYRRSQEKSAASVFNNAFNAAYVGADGQPLCSTAHPSKVPGVAVQSNRGALALTHANLVSTIETMKAFGNDRGEKFLVNPDTLLVPTALEDTALEIVSGKEKPGTADRDVNVFQLAQSRYRIKSLIVWDWLTDSNNWFVIDSVYAKIFLDWYDRIPLEITQDKSSNTFVARYVGYARYQCGWSDWKFVCGNAV